MVRGAWCMCPGCRTYGTYKKDLFSVWWNLEKNYLKLFKQIRNQTSSSSLLFSPRRIVADVNKMMNKYETYNMMTGLKPRERIKFNDNRTVT